MTAATRRRGVSSPGWRQVTPTPLELEAWAALHPGKAHPAYRVQCKGCDTRMWLAGIAVAGHRRRCRDYGDPVHRVDDAGHVIVYTAEADRLTRSETAFPSFAALLDMTDPRYSPSLAVRYSGCRRLADAYDAVMTERGDARRAYRIGPAA